MTCLLIWTFKALMIIFIRILGFISQPCTPFQDAGCQILVAVCTRIVIPSSDSIFVKDLGGSSVIRRQWPRDGRCWRFPPRFICKEIWNEFIFILSHAKFFHIFFSPLKQGHAGKIFVFFMYPPPALALLRGKRTCFRRNKMNLWRTVELLQMDLLCSVSSLCWFQMCCQIQGRAWPSKQQSWHHICRFRVRGWWSQTLVLQNADQYVKWVLPFSSDVDSLVFSISLKLIWVGSALKFQCTVRN